MKDVLLQRWQFSLDWLNPGFPSFLQVRLEYKAFFFFLNYYYLYCCMFEISASHIYRLEEKSSYQEKKIGNGWIYSPNRLETNKYFRADSKS